MPCVGSGSLTRDHISAPALGGQSPSHWTTREVLCAHYHFNINHDDSSLIVAVWKIRFSENLHHEKEYFW